jgi:rod shape-determining protein MreC
VQSVAGIVTSPISTAGAGIQAAQTAAQTTLEDLSADPNTVSELKAQNEELRQMVSELEEYRQEAERLQGIQKLSDTYGIEGMTCHIIGVSGDSWNRVLTIDKGSDDGISVGLPVMGTSGLVGQVKSCTPHTADVRLLQDSSSGVAVLLQSSRAEGLLKGNIDGLLYLEDVDSDVEVKVGDVVVTSGLGGGYFRGLIVGTVVRVEDSNGQAIRKIVVSPNDTISGLEEVMVVTDVSTSKKTNAADVSEEQAVKQAEAMAAGEVDSDTQQGAENTEGDGTAATQEGAGDSGEDQQGSGEDQQVEEEPEEVEEG